MTSNMYDGLALRDREIRLIKLYPARSTFTPIQCTLLKLQLGAPQTYDALSYVWGDLGATKPVIINGSTFNATENLHAALSHLRLPDEERVLWVDAVCIDQSNIQERNRQVLMMRYIYEYAEQVLVWLGAPGRTGELGMDLILRIGYENDQLKDRRDLGESCSRLWSLGTEAWDAMKEIFSRVYWTRVWVYQEFIVSKRVTLICGSEYMSGYAFGQAIMFLIRLQADPSVPKTVSDFILDLNIVEAIPFFSHWNRRQMAFYARTKPATLNLESFDLPLLVLQTKYLESTDPRDKVFGLLGVVEIDDIAVQVDYGKSTADVYCDLQRSIFLARRRLPLISYAGIGIPTTEPSLGLPSWTTDLRCHKERNKFGYFQRLGKVSKMSAFSASGTTSAVADFTKSGILRADGIIASPLREVSFTGTYDTEVWRNFAFKGNQDPQHPTGIPLWQAYFRTMIADDSGYGYGRPEFRDADEEETFYKLAKGFILMGWMSSPQWQAIDSLYYRIYGIGHNRPQVVLEDYAVAFSSWRCELASEEMSLSAVLEPFTGRQEEENRLPWPQSDPPRTEKWYKYLEKDRSDFQGAFHRVSSVCSSKSFFVTDDGYIGLGPPGAVVGDRVCVVLGCDVPLVIRRIGSHFVVVGACYVYGMMKGELVHDAQEGRRKIETLEFL